MTLFLPCTMHTLHFSEYLSSWQWLTPLPSLFFETLSSSDFCDCTLSTLHCSGLPTLAFPSCSPLCAPASQTTHSNANWIATFPWASESFLLSSVWHPSPSVWLSDSASQASPQWFIASTIYAVCWRPLALGPRCAFWLFDPLSLSPGSYLVCRPQPCLDPRWFRPLLSRPNLKPGLVLYSQPCANSE